MKNVQTTNKLTQKEDTLAQDLYKAYKTHQPLNKENYQDWLKNDDSAYKVQHKLTDLKDQNVGGYKVSLTSKQTQDMFSANQPLYGMQVSSHFLSSPTNLTENQLMDPLAEVEMCFGVKQTLLPEDSLSTLMQKTTVAPAVEVPDSRFSNWFPSLNKYLVMADAAVGGFVVYGPEVDTSLLFQSPEELSKVSATLYHNGNKKKDGSSDQVLGNPLKSLHWLVQKLSQQKFSLKKGQRVSSGTFLLPEHVTKGSWKATFNCGLGAVFFNVK